MPNSLDYPTHVKTLSCVVPGCIEPSDAHHRDALGMGSKQRHRPDIRHLSAIPLCRKHHTELHTIGRAKFERKYNVDLIGENWRELKKWASGFIQISDLNLRELTRWLWEHESGGDPHYGKGKK